MTKTLFENLMAMMRLSERNEARQTRKEDNQNFYFRAKTIRCAREKQRYARIKLQQEWSRT